MVTIKKLRNFIQKYDIDFFLINRQRLLQPLLSDNSEDEEIRINRWINQFQPAADEATAAAKQGKIPALAKLVPKCTVFENETLIVLESKCINENILNVSSS